MRRHGSWILLAGVLLGGSLLAQDEPSTEDWMALGQPGAMHKLLDAMVGSFDAVSEMPAMPDAPPSKGQCENSWQLGGRFVESRYSADFMGMPFEGIGFLGYDNINSEFTHIWLDNLGTHMMTSRGSISEDQKSITLQGAIKGPDEDQPFKFVYEIESRDQHVFKMFSVVGGTDVQTLTVTYTRRAESADE